jgi:hypothetical protein
MSELNNENMKNVLTDHLGLTFVFYRRSQTWVFFKAR